MTYASTILGDNPLHWWRFNEGPGALAASDFGSQKHQLYPQVQEQQVGTPFMTPGLAVGQYAFGYEGVTADGGGCAMHGTGFQALDPGPSGGNNPDFEFVVPGSLEYWTYQDSSLWTSNIGWQSFTVTGSAGSWQSQRLGTVLELFLFGLALNPPQSIPADDLWHHVVIAWTSTTVQQYLDGAIKQSLSLSSAVSTSPAVHFFVGGLVVTGDPTMAGMFSEVAIYASQLSSGQVSAHFNAAEMRGHVPKFRGFTSTNFNPPVTGVSADVVHAGLTGTGEIVLTSLYAVGSLLTTLPASYGSDVDTPTFYFDLGWINVITANGVSQFTRVDRVQQFVILPPLATAVSWSLKPGIVMTLTEFSATF
jgi:hypothetical protein